MASLEANKIQQPQASAPQTRKRDERADTGRSPPIQPEAPSREADSKARRIWTRHRRLIIIAAAVVALLILALGVLWWLEARNFEWTDDAFIDTRTVAISSQVNAQIVDVPVTDNQLVEAGTVLVRLDARDFQAQRDQAQAQVDQANASISNLDAQLDMQQAKIDQANKQAAQAKAALVFAQQEHDRAVDLYRKGAGTQQQEQQTASNLRQSQSAFDAAEANATAAEKEVPALQAQRAMAAAQLEQARAALEQARTNLDRTAITAPVAGRVTSLSAAKGAYAQIGQALTMFVPREVWVTANFKETQLALMRPGQPVDISIDAYPGRTFHGHVDSIQSGSGTAFSLLPAENATGNFVKVVQRVPVKIVFDQPPDVLLGPGMSVVPSVKVQ
ncbi:MAG TPA: HlyD family secretion protein [Xanthobacteraceae bacterium]|nr:HlyD family secretion protein [Xanthobacteraceae bacterium]